MKLSNNYLDLARKKADSKADELVHRQVNAGDLNSIYSTLKMDISELQELSASNEIAQFLLNKREQPDWYSEELLERGQRVFEQYAAEIMTLLGVMALPYCYAGVPGNKALYLSDKMRNNPGKRLMDTASFIIDVSSPGSLTEGSKGHHSINKTRLIHAIARYYVSKVDWQQEWGLPINQEDMAGTNLAFSYVILQGLKKSGYSLSDRQREDFIYLWKYIGYQLGIEEQLLPDTFKGAFQLTQLIKMRNFKYSTEGEELTNELMNYYRSVAPENRAEFVEAQVRYFLGEKISSFIGLKPELLKDTITEVLNTFTELQNSFSKHESSYGEMIRNFSKMKHQLKT